MSSNTTDYCVVCGEDREFCHESQKSEFEVRGEVLSLDVPVKICQACGTIEEEEGVDPAEIAFAKYREQKQLLTPERIREIRKRYKLSQKSLARLLGMSEATVNRYEGGGLQSEAHDQAIRSCEEPSGMRDLLDRRGERLSPRQRKRVEEVLTGSPKRRRGILLDASKLWDMPSELSTTTGFRHFDYKRYAAVVVWLCRKLPLVTATSLNKLLFYADFLHFRSESISLTGAAYRRLPYGPVPSDFGGLREQMELDRYVEVEEVEYHNGTNGEEFRPGPQANKLDSLLTTRELQVLKTVAESLINLTPSQISALSHTEAAYRDTPDRGLISYETASDLSLSMPA